MFPSPNLRNTVEPETQTKIFTFLVGDTCLQALACIPLMDARNVLNAASRILHFTQVTIYI